MSAPERLGRPALPLLFTGLVAGLLFTTACQNLTVDPPRPLSITPSVSLVGEAASIRIQGESFHLKLESDLRRDPAARSADAYRARLDTHWLDFVTWSNIGELSALVPATLPAGVYDLILTDPWERETTLESAFAVVEPPIFLTIEEAADGGGVEISQVALPIDTTVQIHAILRNEAGEFLASPVVTWSTDATIATPSPPVASSTSLYALRRGTTVVRANLGEPSLSAQFELQVFGGCTADRECAHPCHGTSACDAGRCVLGPVDRDADADGAIDAACTGGTDCDDDPASCGAACAPGLADPDLCDGHDQDCDGQTDEDWSSRVTSCGTGVCDGNTGATDCMLGLESDSCDPTAGAAADDLSCDGLDDDCDGQTDEDFVTAATTCGTGVCTGSPGVTSCVLGVESDSCDPFAGAAAADDTCDDVDDDCDGLTDQGYLSGPTTCGTGACTGNTGITSCSSGLESDSCDPLEDAASLDDTCDGLDDDCDGQTDEEFTTSTSTCGLGLCAGNTGSLSCVGGMPNDSCDPLAGASADSSCNGLDEDCDGVDFDGSCCAGVCSTCSGGCCTETCLTAPCNLACDGGCDCKQDCSNLGGTCNASCTNGATCSLACVNTSTCITSCDGSISCTVDATNSNSVTLDCLNGSSCDFFCTDSGPCSARCSGGSSCDLDCTNNNSCNTNECLDGSACLIDCTDSPPVRCGFAVCEGGEQSCPDEIVVCNRACP